MSASVRRAMSRNAKIFADVTTLLCIALLNGVAMGDAPTAARPAAGQGAADKTADGYLMATAPRQWSFPRDHGRHDGFKIEWWYFSGNVADDAGRKFGYQLTFFRGAIAPLASEDMTPWSVGNVYVAHAAVSDLAAGKFHYKDRLKYGFKGLATSASNTLDVSLLDWSAKLLQGDAISLNANDASFGIHLKCSDRGVGPVLEGPGGVNQKGPERGQASYYYSMPRMPTSGTIVVDGQSFHVTGQTWMDHEFSSNALGPDQIGWDWVGLTLADGRDLMVYRIRNKSAGADFVSGTLIDAAGHPKYLNGQDIALQGRSPWKSDSGASYPQVWSLAVAGLPPLTIHSRMPGQELRTDATTKIDYFEGSCDVTTAGGQPAGEGYLEMTGYAKRMNQP
jgi:predicted secreted hydrolase